MACVNGQPVTGTVLARNLNRSGADSQPLNVMGNPVPYLPASLSTADAVLTTSTIKILPVLAAPEEHRYWALVRAAPQRRR